MVGTLSFNDKKCTWTDVCLEPSEVPSTKPSSIPSEGPSQIPSGKPSNEPSSIPSAVPSASPSTSALPSEVCSSSLFSVQNDAAYDSLKLNGWEESQVLWEVSLTAIVTKFEFDIKTLSIDDSEEAVLRASFDLLAAAIPDVKNVLVVPDIRKAPGSMCAEQDAQLKITIPNSVSSICFGDSCRPILCRLPPLPSPFPYFIEVPSNNEQLFGSNDNCTVVKPEQWDEWVDFHFGEGEELHLEDFYYADPDQDGVMNLLEYYGLGQPDLFVDDLREDGEVYEKICLEEVNELVFFGVEEAISYQRGTVDLNWIPPYLNSTEEPFLGATYEILVARGPFNFVNLDGTISTCLSSLEELREKFPLREVDQLSSMFRETTNSTNLSLEGLQPGERYSILVVAIGLETSSLNRLESTLTVATMDPIVRENVEHAGEVLASADVIIEQDAQGSWITFMAISEADLPVSLQRILAANLETKDWFLSGVDSENELYQVRVVSITEQVGGFVNLTVTESFIDDIFERLEFEHTAFDLLPVAGENATEPAASRRLDLKPVSLGTQSRGHEIQVEHPVIPKIWKWKGTFKSRVAATTYMLYDDDKLVKFWYILNQIISFTSENIFTFEGSTDDAFKNEVQIWPPEDKEKKFSKRVKFSIGPVPVWINFSPKLLFSYGIKVSAGVSIYIHMLYIIVPHLFVLSSGACLTPNPVQSTCTTRPFIYFLVRIHGKGLNLSAKGHSRGLQSRCTRALEAFIPQSQSRRFGRSRLRRSGFESTR